MNAVVQQSNPFASAAIAQREGNAVAETDQQRAIAETQGAMVIAKRFPRNQMEAMDRILVACARPGLAEAALYEYARGGTAITGPSIRLAEALAQNWGNIQFGIRELEQRNGESSVEAFAWDIETNTRQVKTFQVPHVRFTKNGSKRLEDPRDVYEMVANQGARRLRACILGIIPGDVIEAAVNQCEITLKAKMEIDDAFIATLLSRFAEYGVTKEQIEKRIQRRLDKETLTPALALQLKKIHNSLKDGMSSPADYFEMAPVTDDGKPVTGASALKETAKAKVKKDEPESTTPTGINFAALEKQLREATDLDVLDVAADTIGALEDPKQQDELREVYKARRAALTAPKK